MNHNFGIKKPRRLVLLGALGGVALALSNLASAGSLLWTAPSACTGLNCDATILHANITSSFTNPGGSVEPFIVQLHSSPQYCLRLDVIGENADMEMVLVAPDGTVWKNDNTNGQRPLIVVPRGVQGWYTAHISLASGLTATPGAHFNADLAYGRYTSVNNPNCGHPTAPMLPGPGNS